jgi:CRISPR-associated endonuclease/helicase Cas3
LPLLAKTNPEVTLTEHLVGTLTCARRIIDNYSFDAPTRQAIEISAALHDIGKADANFQKGLRALQNGQKLRLPPHALLGLPIIEKFVENLNKPLGSLALLAVASHHSPFSEKLYETYDANLQLQIAEEYELHDTLEQVSSELGIRNEDQPDFHGPPKLVLLRARDNIVNWHPYSAKAGRLKRELFIKIQGVLEQADWLVSAKTTLRNLAFPEQFISSPNQPRDYQTKAGQIKGNLFITLPTGTGKTETSLYWAKANSKRHQRVFYILPTITTINSMFLRLRRLWPDRQSVAFYHSYIDLFFDLGTGDVDTPNVAEDSTLQFSKYFFNPVNVTTPDQLILALLNHKRYTLKSLPFRDAAFIIDEIHCYDPETFALVKGMIRYLSKEYNAKFCVMSATFPSVLSRELGFLKAANLLDPNEIKQMYRERNRTTLEYADGTMESQLETLKHTKAKVLVVLNTVKLAQDTYRKVKELHDDPNDVMLLHSRYTFRDRRRKEEHLTYPNRLPRILVATQIVEVSLDIDYDRMLTHLCDPLSLVQRAGRVNRKGENKTPAPVRVFKPPTHHPYEKEAMEKAEHLLREVSGKITSELDYLKLTNHYYSELWPSLRHEETEDRYQTVWEKLQYLYSADLSDKEIQQLLQTRNGTISIPAIPIRFKPQIGEINKQLAQTDSVKERMKLYRKKRAHHVNVPVTPETAHNLTKEQNDQYVKMNYDEEYGLHM